MPAVDDARDVIHQARLLQMARPGERVRDLRVRRHPITEPVTRPDDDQADQDSGGDERQGDSELRAGTRNGARFPPEPRQRHRVGGKCEGASDQDQHGEKQKSGELRDERKARGHTGEDDGPWGHAAQGAIEEIHRNEHETGHAQVGRHELSVREDVGVKEVQRGREDSSLPSVQMACTRVDPEAEQERKPDDRNSRPENHPVGVVPVVQELRAEDPLVLAPAAGAGVYRAPGRIAGLDSRPKPQERESGKDLDQRRMLGIHTEVAERDVGVAGGNVGGLVDGRPLLEHAGQRDREEQHREQEQAGSRRPRRFSARVLEND